jgi:hypothetical protein
MARLLVRFGAMVDWAVAAAIDGLGVVHSCRLVSAIGANLATAPQEQRGEPSR